MQIAGMSMSVIKSLTMSKYTHSLPQSVLQKPTITPLELERNAWNLLTALRSWYGNQTQ